MEAGGHSWASTEAIRKTMRANRPFDTKPEVALRSALHRRGRRFRKNMMVRTSTGLKTRPDIVFTRARVAVFVDGCFWHRCPEHATRPTRNGDFWRAKLDANVRRDRLIERELTADGWRTVRVWEHESAEDAAQAVIEVVDMRPVPGVELRG